LRHVLTHPALTEKGRQTERAMLSILGEESPRPLTASVLEKRLAATIPRGKFRNLRYLRQSLHERLESIYLSDPPRDGVACVWIPDGRQRVGYQCRFRRWPVKDEQSELVYKDRGELARAFWRRLIKGDLLGTSGGTEKVHIVFSNELPERTSDRVRPDLGQWSGTGEVIGVFLIARVCQELGLKTRVIRSSLLKDADLNAASPEDKPPMLVFLGSSLAMSCLRQPSRLPPLQLERRLVFGWKGDTEEGQLRQSLEGAATRSYSQASGESLDKDYAAVSVLPAADGRPIVFAAGISSAGTEIAARFLCSNTNHAAEMRLLLAEDASGRRRLRPFEIRFEVEVNHERPRILSADFAVRHELDALLASDST